MHMQVSDFLAALGLQLGNRAHDLAVATAVTTPHRQRRAPKPIARNRPVAGVAQPVAKPLVAYIVGYPAGLLVQFYHPVFDGADFDKPGRHRLVNQRGSRAPAKRVLVVQRGLFEQPAAFFEVANEQLVGLFDRHAHHAAIGNTLDITGELAFQVHRIAQGHAKQLGDPPVVLAKGGGGVDHAGAVLSCDITICNDAESAFVSGVQITGKWRIVGQADQLLAQHLAMDRQARAQHLLGQRLSQNQQFFTIFGTGQHIGDLGPHTQRHVGRQGPRRGRPGQDAHAICTVSVRQSVRCAAHWQRLAGPQRKTHGHGRILDRAVVHPRLKVGQRGAQPPRVRHDLVALVDQALVPQLGKDPPDRLHKLGVHRLVIVVKIDPTAHALYGLAPQARVAQHNRPAGLIVLVHAKGPDLRRRLQTEVLLDLHLNRQTVGIPTKTPLYAVAAHGPIPRDNVLEGAGQQVAIVRGAGGKRRTVIKDKVLVTLSHLAGKSAMFTPELQDLLL